LTADFRVCNVDVTGSENPAKQTLNKAGVNSMSVKKIFTEVHSFLSANQDKTVSSIFNKLEEMMSSNRSSNGSTYFQIDGQTVVAKCSYYDRWFLAEEFHPKAGSPSGFNSLTKQAASHYARQKREAEKAKADLLTAVGSGSIAVTDIAAKLEEIEAARNAILPFAEGTVRWATLEDYKTENGITDSDSE
jgi:hypothetical protein